MFCAEGHVFLYSRAQNPSNVSHQSSIVIFRLIVQPESPQITVFNGLILSLVMVTLSSLTAIPTTVMIKLVKENGTFMDESIAFCFEVVKRSFRNNV